MFTGLVENLGTLSSRVRKDGGWRVFISCAFPADDPLVLGESVAVQGVCLTVAEVLPDGFAADLLDETLRRSALGRLSNGARVNLERAMRANDRFGGHIVQGHVDETGIVQSISDVGRDYELVISCSSALSRQSVMKGSIAIDGVSLTITKLGDDFLAVNIIPHTWRNTSLASLKAGDAVNLESDVIGKHVARLLGFADGGLTEAKLREAGFDV